MGEEYWRLLNVEYEDPYRNVALEEAIMMCVGREEAPCTLRFWRNSRAVVIGSFQAAALEVDRNVCEERNIPIIRRVTGGGAVYHDEGTLNYSLFLVKGCHRVTRDFTRTFDSVGVAVAEALCSLGVEAEHPARNTILVGAKKVSGLAGAVKGGAILVHGSLLVTADVRSLYEALGFTREGLRASSTRRFTRSQRMDVTTLAAALGQTISMTPVKEAIAHAFEGLFAVKFVAGGVNEAEETLLNDLVETKYRLKRWNFKYVNQHPS